MIQDLVYKFILLLSFFPMNWIDICKVFFFIHCYKENVYGFCVCISCSFYFYKDLWGDEGRNSNSIMLFSNQKSDLIFILNESHWLLSGTFYFK